MGLFLQRRARRRPRRNEEPPRRQGREPARDGFARAARASGLHHHHRGLHALLRQRQNLSGRPRRPSRRSGRGSRPPDRARIRRRGQSAAPLGAVRRARVDARHDGHRSQPWAQRQLGRDPGENLRRRAFRLRLLSPLHSDVFQRRARRRRPQFRGHPRALQGRQGLCARHRPQRRRLARGHRRLQGQGRSRRPASRSRRTRAISCGARSAPCSRPG